MLIRGPGAWDRGLGRPAPPRVPPPASLVSAVQFVEPKDLLVVITDCPPPVQLD